MRSAVPIGFLLLLPLRATNRLAIHAETSADVAKLTFLKLSSMTPKMTKGRQNNLGLLTDWSPQVFRTFLSTVAVVTASRVCVLVLAWRDYRPVVEGRLRRDERDNKRELGGRVRQIRTRDTH